MTEKQLYVLARIEGTKLRAPEGSTREPPAFVLAPVDGFNAPLRLAQLERIPELREPSGDGKDGTDRHRGDLIDLSALVVPGRAMAYEKSALESDVPGFMRIYYRARHPRLVWLTPPDPPLGPNGHRDDLDSYMELREYAVLWRLRNRKTGEVYETSLADPRLFLYVMLAYCGKRDIRGVFRRLVKDNLYRTVDLLENGLSIPGEDEPRDIIGFLDKEDLVDFLQHKDLQVRERTIACLGRVGAGWARAGLESYVPLGPSRQPQAAMEAD